MDLVNRLMRIGAPSLPVSASLAPAQPSVPEFGQRGVWSRLKQMLDTPMEMKLEGADRTEAQRRE